MMYPGLKDYNGLHKKIFKLSGRFGTSRKKRSITMLMKQVWGGILKDHSWWKKYRNTRRSVEPLFRSNLCTFRGKVYYLPGTQRWKSLFFGVRLDLSNPKPEPSLVDPKHE